MKAVRIHPSGDASLLRVDEVQPPQAMEDDQMLVRIRDAGVNGFDFAPRISTSSAPRTLGMDFSGQVAASGDRVEGFLPGDRVFGFANGSYAEYAIIPATLVARMPKSVDFDAAAALPTPGLSAYQIMMHEVQVEENQTVLLHGAAGTIGALSVQLGAWQRANIIAVASGEDVAYLHSLGVRQVVDYRTQRFEDHVEAADAVVDLVGGDVTARSCPLVKKGGVIVSTAGALDQAALERHGIRGVQFALKPNGAQLSVVARLVDEGILKPRLQRVLPLVEAGLAQELLLSRSHGKIVLSVSHP
jgi:NADPH:quinone reductase-like Zn-dependent oxidoreductase